MRLGCLVVIPAVVLGTVIAVPLVYGDYPLQWGRGTLDWRPSGTAQAGERAGQPRPSPPPAARAAAPTPSARPGVRRTVARPWTPGQPQWGVQVYWEDQPALPDSEIEAKARRAVNYLVGLGANAVSVSFPFYMTNERSSGVRPRWPTPTARRLGIFLAAARAARLRVTVRPILDEATLVADGGWRGSITPASRAAWFASYQRFLRPYARMAERRKVKTFVVGTELNSLERDQHWTSLAAALRRDFSGEIEYSANWDAYLSRRVTMPVDRVTLDAYFPVHVPDTAPVSQLVAGWDEWLRKSRNGPESQILLSEVGIGAEDGAYDYPSNFRHPRQLNPQVQANWYRAVCTVARTHHLPGVYWWSLNLDTDPLKPPPPHASRMDFAGRPLTESAIRSCFATTYHVTTDAGTQGGGE